MTTTDKNRSLSSDDSAAKKTVKDVLDEMAKEVGESKVADEETPTANEETQEEKLSEDEEDKETTSEEEEELVLTLSSSEFKMTMSSSSRRVNPFKTAALLGLHRVWRLFPCA